MAAFRIFCGFLILSHQTRLIIRRRVALRTFEAAFLDIAPSATRSSLHKMRQLAADPALRSSITMDAAADECLFSPISVVRQAKTSGEVAGCPFKKARSSSSACEARGRAQRIVTSSSSIRVGAVVLPKSGCLRCWEACGRVCWVRCMSPKRTSVQL